MGKKNNEPNNEPNNDKEVLELQNTILDLNKELDELKLKNSELEKIKTDFDELNEKYNNVTKLNSELLIKNTKLSSEKSKEVEPSNNEDDETLSDFISTHFNSKGE